MSDRSRRASRQDTRRDYEKREAHGAARSRLKGDTGPGSEVSCVPALSQSGAREATTDDALEENISNRFSNHDGIDEDHVTVTVQHGVAKLSGNVETLADAAMAARIASAVQGVRAVYNLLVPIGVDGHIPDDVTRSSR